MSKKWKNLKDTFRKKFKEEKKYVPSGSGVQKTREPWKYYQCLQFLIPAVDIRSTSSNLGTIKTTLSTPLPSIAKEISPFGSPCNNQSETSSSETFSRKSKRSRNNSISSGSQSSSVVNDLLMKEISKPVEEEEAFCQFLLARMKKLDRKRYIKLTHAIIIEVMKVELEEL
ncbi:uncharacterized protein [Mycetomoellerius zeteki]|uniref:uncharacterized protein n=1 Tax=Mycetomoellerius zeteki TaxID=64791 RepID=UPI00084E5C6B|nr:PREDICTED: uncharacterized protein LOC108725029 [Trachymyrmex zeteki]